MSVVSCSNSSPFVTLFVFLIQIDVRVIKFSAFSDFFFWVSLQLGAGVNEQQQFYLLLRVENLNEKGFYFTL